MAVQRDSKSNAIDLGLDNLPSTAVKASEGHFINDSSIPLPSSGEPSAMEKRISAFDQGQGGGECSGFFECSVKGGQLERMGRYSCLAQTLIIPSQPLRHPGCSSGGREIVNHVIQTHTLDQLHIVVNRTLE